MKTTGNLGLKKPEGTDLVDIDDLNGNMDILDTVVKNVQDTSVKKLTTPYNGLPSGAGWKRIAIGAGGLTKKIATFELAWGTTGAGGNATIEVSINDVFGPSITQTACSSYGTMGIPKVRLVYGASGSDVYFEVMKSPPVLQFFEVYMVGAVNWSLPASGQLGAIPSGYGALELNLMSAGKVSTDKLLIATPDLTDNSKAAATTEFVTQKIAQRTDQDLLTTSNVTLGGLTVTFDMISEGRFFASGANLGPTYIGDGLGGNPFLMSASGSDARFINYQGPFKFSTQGGLFVDDQPIKRALAATVLMSTGQVYIQAGTNYNILESMDTRKGDYGPDGFNINVTTKTFDLPRPGCYLFTGYVEVTGTWAVGDTITISPTKTYTYDNAPPVPILGEYVVIAANTQSIKVPINQLVHVAAAVTGEKINVRCNSRTMTIRSVAYGLGVRLGIAEIV